jgi:hypothetical protein
MGPFDYPEHLIADAEFNGRAAAAHLAGPGVDESGDVDEGAIYSELVPDEAPSDGEVAEAYWEADPADVVISRGRFHSLRSWARNAQLSLGV